MPNPLSHCMRAALLALCLSAAHGAPAPAASDSLGSALLSPFAPCADSGAVNDAAPKATPSPAERDPDSTMTLAASLAAVVAAVWLLRHL